MTDIGERIQTLRRAGLSTRSIAAALDVSVDDIVGYNAGAPPRRNPDIFAFGDAIPLAGSWTLDTTPAGFALVGDYVQGFGSLMNPAGAKSLPDWLLLTDDLPEVLRPLFDAYIPTMSAGELFTQNGTDRPVNLIAFADGRLKVSNGSGPFYDNAMDGYVFLDPVRWVAPYL